MAAALYNAQLPHERHGSSKDDSMDVVDFYLQSQSRSARVLRYTANGSDAARAPTFGLNEPTVLPYK